MDHKTRLLSVKENKNHVTWLVVEGELSKQVNYVTIKKLYFILTRLKISKHVFYISKQVVQKNA